MTESTEQKTRRKFSKLYLKYDWRFKTTVFLQEYEDRLEFLEYARVMRRELPKVFPETAFLWRLILSRAKTSYFEGYDGKAATTDMPAITLFHYARISREELRDGLEAALAKHSSGAYTPLYVKGQSVTTEKYHSYPKTVKNGKPQNLEKYFSLEKCPQRYGIINKKHAFAWNGSKYDFGEREGG
tara:strand:- start:8512 stop:9066 length:555 start_codon:yes stop_codon:yes gene_type:complete